MSVNTSSSASSEPLSGVKVLVDMANDSGGHHQMEPSVYEGSESFTEPSSASPATTTKTSPSAEPHQYIHTVMKDEKEIINEKVKRESISLSPKAAIFERKEPRKSLFGGVLNPRGTLRPNIFRRAPGPGETDPTYSGIISSGEKKKTIWRPIARTAEEIHTRRYESEPKKRVSLVRNSTISGRKKKDRRIKSNTKKARPDKKTSQKLQQRLGAADPFSLDLGKESPTFRARTQKEQFENLLADCPEYHDLHKRGVSKNALSKACASFGRGKMRALDGKWKMKGMNSALYSHQLIGASWMVSRECSSQPPQGGILADDMGLGKTIQCVNTIIANPPDHAETTPRQRTTLIVVPSNILSQWMKELKKHGGDSIEKIDVYKASDNRDAIIYTSSDVVLTTFRQLMESLPWPDKETLSILRRRGKSEDRHTDDAECSHVEGFIKKHWERAGVLHQIDFYRVIVDEGHYAKNHLSRTSLALHALKSKHRWILTGTPFMNRLEDFYSYFRFLKDPDVTTFSKFSAHYCNFENKESNSRLDKKLAKLMTRTMEDRILGQPLIKLPRAHYRAINVKLNAAEEILYQAVEEKFQELRDAKLGDDDPRKPMSYTFSQISHLRQLVSHPALIERKIMILFDEEELVKIRESIQALDPVLHERMVSWIRGERAKVVAECKALLKEEMELKICIMCQEEVEDSRELPVCKHLFCEFCLRNNTTTELAEGGAEICHCPACNEPFEYSELEITKELPEKMQNKHTKKFIRGRDARKYIPATQKSVWLDQYDRGTIGLRPGSKLEAVMEQVQEWFAEHPKKKIIIYTQWKMVSTIIGRMLEEEKISFLYYSGDMSRKARDTVIDLLETKPSIKVLVSGLKCGGLGLNLTFAKKVISVELWWNPWAEKQAFGRVFRIGQNEETTFARVIVADSIEERLAELQVNKLKINSIAMQDKLTKADEEFLLANSRSKKNPHQRAVSFEDSIYAKLSTDPNLNPSADTSKQPVEEDMSGDISEDEEEDEDETMVDIDDEESDKEEDFEFDGSSFAEAPKSETIHATCETDSDDEA